MNTKISFPIVETRSAITLVAVSVFFLLAPGFIHTATLKAQQSDFQFSLKSVLDPDAEKYVVEKENIRTFAERFKPFVSYWGVTQNDKPARMTFRVPLEKPLRSGQFHAGVVCANFENNKSFGSGVGRGSLWCSRDGKQWIQLIDAPPPDKTSLEAYTYHANLPRDLKGTTEIWLQVRLQATGMKDATYSVAQFARKHAEDPNSQVFSLRVKYDEKANSPANPSPNAKPTG